MIINSFEDVQSWRIGKELYLDLSEDFKNSKDYIFKDQLLRATLSITNNIAEGFDRGSDKELRQFLIISRGSCAEVRSMLHIAYADKKLDNQKYKKYLGMTTDISKLLTGFIKKLTTGDKSQATRP